MPRAPCSVHMFFTVNRKPQPIPEKDNVQGFRVYGPEQTTEFLNVLFYLTTSVSFTYFMLALLASISARRPDVSSRTIRATTSAVECTKLF
eukprot:s3568_g3.t1